MSKVEITPGPWEITYTGKRSIGISQQGETRISTVDNPTMGVAVTGDHMKGNAQLIIKSPKLLEIANELILEYFERNGPCSCGKCLGCRAFSVTEGL